jgi:hypothetical protein
MWIPELRSVENLDAVFQPWKLSKEDQHRLGLTGADWVQRPLKRIEFTKKGVNSRRKDFPRTEFARRRREAPSVTPEDNTAPGGDNSTTHDAPPADLGESTSRDPNSSQGGSSSSNKKRKYRGRKRFRGRLDKTSGGHSRENPEGSSDKNVGGNSPRQGSSTPANEDTVGGGVPLSLKMRELTII